MSQEVKYVPQEERPEITAENVPDDIVEEAVSIAVRYGECRACGTRQFYPSMHREITSWPCANCGSKMVSTG